MELERWNESLDETLDVVADARRRTVLHFLREQSDNTSSIDELVRYLDTRGEAPGDERTTTPEQLEIQLQHRHIPKLEEHGLVEYDVRSGRIRYYPDETTEDLLEFVRTL